MRLIRVLLWTSIIWPFFTILMLFVCIVLENANIVAIYHGNYRQIEDSFCIYFSINLIILSYLFVSFSSLLILVGLFVENNILSKRIIVSYVIGLLFFLIFIFFDFFNIVEWLFGEWVYTSKPFSVFGTFLLLTFEFCRGLQPLV